MAKALSRRERKDRAARLIEPAMKAMGLSPLEASRKMAVPYRTFTAWRDLSDPDRPRPTGRNLLKVEAFLSRALRTLKARGLVKETIEELVK